MKKTYYFTKFWNTKDWQKPNIITIDIALCQTVDSENRKAETYTKNWLTVILWNRSLTKSSHHWDGWILIPFLKTFFLLNIILDAKPSFSSIFGRQHVFIFLTVRSHPSNHRPPTSISEWFVVWIKNNQCEQIVYWSWHPRIYLTRGMISGLDADSL